MDGIVFRESLFPDSLLPNVNGEEEKTPQGYATVGTLINMHATVLHSRASWRCRCVFALGVGVCWGWREGNGYAL